MLIADVSDDMMELVNKAHRELGAMCRKQAIEFRRMAMRSADPVDVAYAQGAAAAMEAVAKVFEAR